MKIIHISDLHLDAVYRQDNYRKTNRLLEHICELGFDHLVITGDVTENPEKSALKLARRILKRFNLLRPDKTTIIIGNHDIFGGVHLAEDVISFPKKCRTTDYNGRVHEFTSAFNETYSTTLSASSKNVYPFIKEFDNFIILGLNSIAEYSVMKNPFASNGTISAKQMQDAIELIRIGKFQNKKLMVLTHHHFCKGSIQISESESTFWRKIENHTMKLRNKKSIISFLNEINTGIVLHGHLHETTIYKRKGLTFANAGASVFGDDKTSLSFQVIDFNGSDFIPRIESIKTQENIPKFIYTYNNQPKDILPAFESIITPN